MNLEAAQPPLRDEPPSTYAISAWVNKEPGAFGRVVNLTLTRMLFIAPGLFIAGVRDPWMLTKATLGATTSITLSLALVYRFRGRAGASSRTTHTPPFRTS